MDEMEIVARLTATEDRIEKLEKRQDNLDKLLTIVAGMQKDIEYQGRQLSEVATQVRSIAEKPEKRWDTFVAALISAVVGVAIGIFTRGVM